MAEMRQSFVINVTERQAEVEGQNSESICHSPTEQSNLIQLALDCLFVTSREPRRLVWTRENR